MSFGSSLTKRITASVLVLEFVAALALIGTAWNHEKHVQFDVFKANLRAHSNGLFGALQEVESKDGNIALDKKGLTIPQMAIYSITESDGTVIAASGAVPKSTANSGSFVESSVNQEKYLFYVLTGDHVIDPGKPFAVTHHVRIMFGLPVARVWHEIHEAVRFYAFATVGLLGVTAVSLTWLIQRLLQPIMELATEADRISSETWMFEAPHSSQHLKELKPLASAIERSISRLHRSFEQQRRFTSDAAHELKTDIAIVKSSIQVLMMKQRTADEYKQGLVLSLEDVGRMESAVQRMLMLARVEQAAKDERQRCSFPEALLEAIAQSEPLATVRNIKLDITMEDIPQDVALSRADSVLLCSNLLVNALQYSPKTGTIDVSLTRKGQSIRMCLGDRGVGIAAGDAPFLFDPFYRGDASRSRETGGSGLGLAICKAISNRVSGSITIDNHPDGGAVVEVLLPMLAVESAQQG